jgi:hypothetical protein
MIVTDHGFKPFTKQELQTMREPELNAIAGQLIGAYWVMEKEQEARGPFLAFHILATNSPVYRAATQEEIPAGAAISDDKVRAYSRSWSWAWELVDDLRDAVGYDMERYEFAEYLPSRGHGDTDLFALTPRLLVEAFVWTITNRRV